MALLWVLGPGAWAAAPFKTPPIEATALLAALGTPDAPLVIDVRDPIEYKAAHVPGALNVPYAELEMRLDEVDRARGVVLYCFDGRRTRQAETVLLDNGFRDVRHLTGGIPNWVTAGHPVEKGMGR